MPRLLIGSPIEILSAGAYPHTFDWADWWALTTIRDEGFEAFARGQWECGNMPGWAEHCWRHRDPNQPRDNDRTPRATNVGHRNNFSLDGPEAKVTRTPEQLDQIAKLLLGTTQNVYRVAERVLGTPVEEEIFDELKEHSNIFKCEECNEWMHVSNKDRALDGLCTACVDAMNDDLNEEPEWE